MQNPYLPISPESKPTRLRVWPGLLILVSMVFVLVVPGLLFPRTSIHFMSFAAGPALAMIGGIVWWGLWAGASSPARWLIPVLWIVPMIGFAVPTAMAGHPPMNAFIYGWPYVFTLSVIAVSVAWFFGRATQMIALYSAVMIGWCSFGLVRIAGTDADLAPELHWIWQPSVESVAGQLDQRVLVNALPSGDIVLSADDWPGFRGAKQDSAITTGRFDFSTPPKLLWKQDIGPGWGSFCVVGKRAITQEQRGDNEAIVCYRLETGEEMWRYSQAAKFWETIGGVGPRATPTYHDGRLYVAGATGMLDCLDVETGKPIWTVGLVAAAEAVVPEWGMAASPLVHDGRVFVYTGGKLDQLLTALDADTGAVLWQSGKGTHGYASPHLATIHGGPQILMMSNYGVEAFDPQTGTVLWDHVAELPSGNRATQPVVLDDGNVLFCTGVGTELGTKRLKITKLGSEYRIEQVWFTKKLKPYFNDGVVYRGHYYGFDDKAFVCVDLSDGSLKWNAGTKYGHGQMLLLAEQGLLVVQQVNGSVAIVKADPSEFNEEFRLPGVKGKTWNHPVIAHGKLLVRNGAEVACYELTRVKSELPPGPR